MNKQEREKLREFTKVVEPNNFVIESPKLIALLDHIDALEYQVERQRNIIRRAIGWVEEIRGSCDAAVQHQRSFIEEMRAAVSD